MGMVSPMPIGSLNLVSEVLASREIAAGPWVGSILSLKTGNGVTARSRARMKVDRTKAEFERWGVDYERKGARIFVCNADGREGRVGEIDGVVEGMRSLLASEQKEVASQAAIDLVSSLDQQGRAALLTAFYRSSVDEGSEDHFKEADTNLDGIIDQKEFATYAEAQAIKYGNSSKPITTQQKLYLFTKAAVGMVGFGFTDNAIMIIAGDAIQNSIGATLGLTTLLSAGLGNALADLFGTAFSGYIERLSGRLMPQDVPVSALQMQQKEAWWAETFGASCGVTVGCLLGLMPLFLLQNKRDEPSTIPTKLASISSSTTASPSFFSPLEVDAVAVASDNALQNDEHSTQVTSLTTSVQPAVTPLLQLRSFQPKLFGTPFLLSMVVLFMALRRVVNYMKAFGAKNRN